MKVYLQNKNDMSTFFKKYNCDLQVFPLKVVEQKKYNNHKTHTRNLAILYLFLFVFLRSIMIVLFDNSARPPNHTTHLVRSCWTLSEDFLQGFPEKPQTVLDVLLYNYHHDLQDLQVLQDLQDLHPQLTQTLKLSTSAATMIRTLRPRHGTFS